MAAFDNPNRSQRPGMWRRDEAFRTRERDTGTSEILDAHQLNRMQWRAAGAQFYPGGAYEQLSEMSFRGRGPKGYRRSDELLKEIICEELTDDPFIDARNVSVDVSNCEVTLHGSVDAREQKHAIEDLVADVIGVAEIHNHLSVANPDIDDANYEP
jgi:hypothetical protein